jgi:hypothetical protein
MLFLALDGRGSAQTNIYVDSIGGSDGNSGCDKFFPKQTLTNAIASATLSGCNPTGPWVIRMRADSNFPEGPISLPPDTKLAYWDPANTGSAVTISGGSPVITISTATGPASLTATTGLDGSGGASGTRNIRIVTLGAGILVESTGSLTNGCGIRNVRIEHNSTGVRFNNQGGVISSSVTDCTFFTPAPGPPTPTFLAGGSEHIFLQHTGPGTPGSTIPSFTGCLLELAAGTALERGVFAHSGPEGTMSPSFTSCTVTGNGAGPVLGFFFWSSISNPSTVSPSISSCSVRACGDTGIFFAVGISVSGSPTITSTTVSESGLAMGPVSPVTPWRGNGIAFVVEDGGALTPTVSGTTIDQANNHGLGLFTNTATGTSSGIGGDVRGCTILKSGRVTPAGDGVHLRGVVTTPGGVTTISTAFNDNEIRESGNDGVALFTDGFGDGINYSSITSVFTNNVIHHSGEDGVDLLALTSSEIAPTFTYNTIALNGAIGWREGPLLQVGFTPQIFNSIIRFNTGAPNPDAVFVGGGAQPFYSNFFNGLLLGNNNNGQEVALNFANAAAGDFHLAIPPPIPGGQIIDFATTLPPGAPTSDFDSEGRVFDHPNVGSTPIADRGADEARP